MHTKHEGLQVWGEEEEGVISSSRCKHLISLLERYDLRQMAHLPLHAVDALNDDKNLLPGPPRFRLPICYAVPE